LDTGSVEAVDQAVWQCATCNACGLNCPRGIDIIDVVKAVRRYEIGGDRIPEPLSAPLESLEANGNPWQGLPANRLDWAREIKVPAFAPEHDYCLFTCCTTAYGSSPAQIKRKGAQALPQLLATAGITFGTLGPDENCCGDPADKMGADQTFGGLVHKNTELMVAAGVKKILTTSPHCLHTFKHHYAGLKGVVAFEHYSELLARLVTEGRLNPTQPINLTVTYHDPCYLGRHSGIYDAPRRILGRLPGVTFIEMANNRQQSVCCGGGGGGAWGNGDARQQLGPLRVQEAMKLGVEVIATACPYCIRMLDAAVEDLGVADRIAIRDLAELLWSSMAATIESETEENAGVSVDQEVCHV
jgi:Fe-S oxidoreductase